MIPMDDVAAALMFYHLPPLDERKIMSDNEKIYSRKDIQKALINYSNLSGEYLSLELRRTYNMKLRDELDKGIEQDTLAIDSLKQQMREFVDSYGETNRDAYGDEKENV